MRAHVADVITSLALVTLALWIYGTSAGFRTFSRGDVGPAFFPRLVAVTLLVLAVLLLSAASRNLWSRWRQRSSAVGDAPSVRPVGLERVWLGLSVAVLAAYPWAVARTGFIVTTIVLNAVLMRAVGEKRWWMIALVAAVAGFAIYAVFYYGLRMPLPQGSLFEQG